MSIHAAVIGVGFVGRAHLEALRRLAVPVRGILGSTPGRTEQAARELRVERGYRSLEELVEDPSIHVVHVCTPNNVHHFQSKAAIEAGKHVMCEKPLAMNTAESGSLVQLAHQLRRVGGVAYNLRYYPLCHQARSLVERGLIGEPQLVHGSFLQDWLSYPTDWNWRLEPEVGGDVRVVADIGTHWLDLLTWIIGRKVTSVCADLATVIPVRRRPRGRVETFQQSVGQTDEYQVTTDDYASVLLHFEGNVHGVCTVSQVSAGRKTRLWFEVNGTEGSLSWNSEEPNALWIGRRREPNQEIIKDPSLFSPEVRRYAGYPGGHAEGYPDTFVQLFKDFYGYLEAADLAAARLFPTFEIGHEEIQLCQAIVTSSREHRWVSLS
ncbi:MAG: Gfo/Idh/MocA family oxidoreductase [Acidobacteria bacterium]|nr:Gfo/Idh/MocA family oxidoreductase [Acidobacteriota bacterium]